MASTINQDTIGQKSEHQKKLSIMTTQTFNMQQDLVKDLRKIREEISREIKDMTFEQERMYLDKLLANKEKSAPNNISFQQLGHDV